MLSEHRCPVSLPHPSLPKRVDISPFLISHFVLLLLQLLLSLPLSPSPSASDPLHAGLHRLFQAMLDSQTPVNTSVFTQPIHFPQFDVRQMNDPQDFFNRLVNGLNSELKNTPLRGLVSSLLSGRLIRRTPLEQRGRMSVSVHPEHFWSLRVPMELGNGVEDVLPKLLIPDQHGNTQRIYSLPPVLVVDLVRWTSGPGGLMKNNKRFAFPTSLDLSRMIEPLTLTEKMNAIQKKKEIKKAKGQAPSAQSPQSHQLQQSLAFNEPRHAAQKLVYSSELSGLGESEKEQAWMAKQKTGPFYSQSFRYSLLAVEVHSGSLTMGHYYSFIRPLGTREWFECNDETIRRVEESEAIEGQFGGVVDGREVDHSAMSLVYVQNCHADKIAMKETVITKMQSEIDSLRQQCDHLQSQLRQAEENNTSNQLTINNLKRNTTDIQNRNKVIEEERFRLNQTVLALNDELKNAEQAKNQVETQIQRLNQERRTATANIEKEREEMKRQIAVLRRDLEQRAKELKDTKQEMAKQETSHQETIELLSRSEANNRKMKDELTRNTKDFQNRYRAIEEERNNVVTELETEKEKTKTLSMTLDRMEKDRTSCEDMKKDLDRLRQELEEQKRKTKVAPRTAAQSEEERRKIDEKLKDEERKRQELQQEINNLTAQHRLEMDQLQKRNQELRNKNEIIQRHLQTEKENAESLRTKLSEVQSQLRQAERKGADLQRERRQDKERIYPRQAPQSPFTQTQNDKHVQQIQSLNSTLEKRNQEISELKRQIVIQAREHPSISNRNQTLGSQIQAQERCHQKVLREYEQQSKQEQLMKTQHVETMFKLKNKDIKEKKDKNQRRIQRLESEKAEVLSEIEAGRELSAVNAEHSRFLACLQCHVIQILGQGTSGTVYLVQYQGGLAAVKIISPIQNIGGEQKYAVHFIEKGIKNPFYIRIRLTAQIEGQSILMMDYANLPALNRLIDGRLPPLPESVVGLFIRQILLCIAEFSDHGFLHRDLKLENIFLHFDGDDSVFVQVSEFDLLISESEAPSSKDVVGTPVYLAPEIVYLSPRYSHKSDIWAIGVMMFILLCRTYPFQGTSTHQLYTSIQTKPHTITRRDLSQHCTDAINALLSKSPDQRPSAREALELPYFKQFEEDAKSGVTWSTFTQVTSGFFPKPPPQIFYIPDTHRTEQNYRHVSPLRRAQNRPSSHSQPAPASLRRNPTCPPTSQKHPKHTFRHLVSFLADYIPRPIAYSSEESSDKQRSDRSPFDVALRFEMKRKSKSTKNLSQSKNVSRSHTLSHRPSPQQSEFRREIQDRRKEVNMPSKFTLTLPRMEDGKTSRARLEKEDEQSSLQQRLCLRFSRYLLVNLTSLHPSLRSKG
ncbi:putative serine/threonine protein kinase [Blattamonas nauphoetae]|uniref:Serine/threonine protein kinase n=1 Tax=Blattamonas nauphoetae TaxID=2049346 RepID=A0ABQ9X707_9EUKA|nr:putative serine/threonine protein kinase [Blattamonas nauphoetae]